MKDKKNILLCTSNFYIFLFRFKMEVYFGKPNILKKHLTECRYKDIDHLVLNWNTLIDLYNEDELVLREKNMIYALEQNLHYHMIFEKEKDKNMLQKNLFSYCNDFEANEKLLRDFNSFLTKSGYSIELKMMNRKLKICSRNKNFEFRKLPFNLKIKLAIAIWIFDRKNGKPVKEFKVILDQIDCHLDEKTLDSINEILLDLKAKFNNFNIILTSHSRKNFNFFIKSKHLKYEVKQNKLKTDKTEKVKITENDFCFEDLPIDCEHGLIKRFIGAELKEYTLKPILTINGWVQHKPEDFLVLKNIIWENIPKFSVITGKNGVGKTTTLNFLKNYYKSSILINFETRINDKQELNTILNNLQASVSFKKNLETEKKGQYSEGFLTIRLIIQSNLENIPVRNLVQLLTLILYLEDATEINSFLKKKCFKYKIKILNQFQINLISDIFNRQDPLITQNSLLNYIDVDENVFFEPVHSDKKIDLRHVHLTIGERIVLFLYLWEFLIEKGYTLNNQFTN